MYKPVSINLITLLMIHTFNIAAKLLKRTTETTITGSGTDAHKFL